METLAAEGPYKNSCAQAHCDLVKPVAGGENIKLSPTRLPTNTLTPMCAPVAWYNIEHYEPYSLYDLRKQHSMNVSFLKITAP